MAKDKALGENGAYWAQRMRFYEQACARKNLKITAEIDAAFSKANADIERDLEYWYGRLARNNGISLSAARRLLDADELAEFKWSVDEYAAKARQSGNGKWFKELENASARVHISRLDAMKISMRNTLENVFGAENDLVTKLAGGTYRDAVRHTATDMEKLFKAEFNIGEIDDEKIQKLIRKPWTPDARTFSDRIWSKKNEMINALQEELTRGCIYGRSLDETIARMEKFVDAKFKNAKYAARRIVVTESAYFRVLGTRDELERLGVKEFQVDLPVDAKTCEICREMNGRIFPMSEFAVGLNAPPFHPNCENGSIIPVTDEDFEESLREAREKKPNEGLTKGRSGGTIKARKASSLSYDGKTKHYAHKIGSIDISDQSAVDQMVEKFEKRYVESELEHCLIIRPNGDVYVARGDKRSVNTSDLMGDKMLASFTSHNHPKDVTQYSFSEDDFLATLFESGKRMRAFDFKYEYEAVFPDRLISEDELLEAYYNAKSKATDVLVELGLGFDDYEENIQHLTISEMCKQLGIKYTRCKRND